MNKIFFIADAFLHDGYYGGAERCDECLIEELLMSEYNDFRKSAVVCINCVQLEPQFIEQNSNSLFIIANFITLSEENKRILIKNEIKYIIIEHDHKYLKSNNPVLYTNYLANEDEIQNVAFYKNAYAVICQSSLHAETVYKNILLDNIVNLRGNLWTEGDLNTLETYEYRLRGLGATSVPRLRPYQWGVLNSTNPNKGVPETLEYIRSNKIDLDKITYLPKTPVFADFVKDGLSQVDGVMFFPTWMETFNRFVVEARALNCKIKTNERLGCISDGYLQLRGSALIQRMRQAKQEIFKTYEKMIENVPVEKFKISLPRISIITTFIDAEEYIEEFLQHIIGQTIFDEIDLIIYDAGSTSAEQKIISRYLDIHKNIHYIRNEEHIGSSEAFNKMIAVSKNELISQVMMDDRPTPDYAEKLRKHLFFGDADLVYGDCVTTNKKNDRITSEFYTTDSVYEHSKKEFSPENMIKCLPGPMPMFKKEMVTRSGGFNITYKHANDWELWLRCVREGATFRKVKQRLGLYYINPDGVTTSAKTFKSKIREENKIFNEYKDVLGEKNYNLYNEYFGQFEPSQHLKEETK